MPNPDLLQGWKEIAAFVARDVSTVKRWEKNRGLPVRRVPGGGRANVFAHATELTRWLSSAGPDIQNGEIGPDPNSPAQRQSRAPAAAGLESKQVRPVYRQMSWIVFAGAIILTTATLTLIARTYRVRSPVPSAGEAASLLRYSSSRPGVEDIYLRGVYAYEKRTPESLASAETYFQETAAKDPRYAPAYVGLAITYNLMREFSTMNSEEGFSKSRSAAEKAISLDPRLCEAHAALGFVEFFADWKAADAEREFQTSITLDPGSALARHWYGSMLLHEGRFAEAVEQLDEAQRLAPSSTSILLARGMAIGFAGHRNEGIDLLRQIGAQDPEFQSTHLRLGTLSMLEPHDVNMMVSETEMWAQLTQNSATLDLYHDLERALRSGGEVALWQTLSRDERVLHPAEMTIQLAAAEAELGNKDESLAILQNLADRRAPELIGINLKPQLQSLQSDPRYNKILANMGLPPVPQR